MANSNGTEVYLRNHRGIYSDAITLTRNTPIQPLPSHPIPDNVAIVVKNNSGNPAGLQVLVDGRKISSNSYPLLPGDSIPYYVTDASALFVGVLGPFPAGVNEVIVNYTFEID